jgi:RHS repeat-associated protein
MENHYYAFGMQMNGSWMNNAIQADNRYQYNGKAMNDDFGLNLYDYGARMYDPVLGRFASVDRFTEKYTIQSTYAYAANNAVKYIDVNGDSIAIIVNRKNVAFYENGKLYNRDRTPYTGKGVKINKHGTVKLKGFLKATVAALDQIRTGGSAGNKLVSNAQSDKDMYVIRQQLSSGSGNENTGRIVRFNPNGSEGGIDENGNRERPPFIGLAQEMSHASDLDDDGYIDKNTWYTNSDKSKVMNAEKFVCHIENQIRAENKLPLRQYYGIDSGVKRGDLIYQGTRMSTNYSMKIGPLQVPYIYPK